MGEEQTNDDIRKNIRNLLMFFFLGIFQKRFGNGEKGVHSNILVELFQVWISKRRHLFFLSPKVIYGQAFRRLTCITGWAILPDDFPGKEKQGRGEAGISRGGWR
jgi:hypothetical protein